MQNIPSHVPKELVFPFNMYNDARTKGDIHEGLATLFRDAPDLFYTPENGGHWVATRYELMNEIVKDHERFSSREVRVPRVEGSYIAIPLNLDPPEHTFFRLILMHHFSPSAIRRLETRIRHWAKFLIGEIAGKGKCDFADTVGSLFPVSIFMELMGLPLERLREYRALVVEYFGDISAERRVELEKLIGGEMRQVIEARQIERRDDLISKLLDEEVDGKKMTLKELEDLANLMFQAGMDTVANFATFFFRYMGYRPELQRLLHENPDRIPDIVEEGFRMFGVVNNGSWSSTTPPWAAYNSAPTIWSSPCCRWVALMIVSTPIRTASISSVRIVRTCCSRRARICASATNWRAWKCRFSSMNGSR